MTNEIHKFNLGQLSKNLGKTQKNFVRIVLNEQSDELAQVLYILDFFLEYWKNNQNYSLGDTDFRGLYVRK